MRISTFLSCILSRDEARSIRSRTPKTAAQRFHLLIGQGNRLSSDANNGMDTRAPPKISHSVLTGGFYEENVTREQWPLIGTFVARFSNG